MATTHDLLKYLSANEVEYSLLAHGSVDSAYDLAKAVRVPTRIIVQTTLVKVDEHCWMIVTPADRKVNLASVCRILGGKGIHKCDLSDWNFYFPNCEINTMPPFGNLYGIGILVDKSLEQGRQIVFSAYSHTQSIFMRWDTYVSLVEPIVAEICDEAALPESQIVQQAVVSY
jgi:Ala-tRNA(Pro) deacylase